MSRLFLEAITVCAGYADFLAETVPTVRGQVDRWGRIALKATVSDEERAQGKRPEMPKGLPPLSVDEQHLIRELAGVEK